MRAGAVLALFLLLSGCKAVPAIVGIAGGAAAGGATGNPAVAFAVGVGLDAVSDYALKYYGRTRQQAEQDAIAAVAGGLPVGGTANWEIRHTIPIGNERGTLRVVRDIANPLAPCREVAFSVQDGDRRSWFTTSLCHQAQGWKWAGAEPAVERWGFLQ